MSKKEEELFEKREKKTMGSYQVPIVKVKSGSSGVKFVFPGTTRKECMNAVKNL